MKIIYDHQIFIRQKYGGISRYFFELASRIPSMQGNHADIFAPLHINAYLGDGAQSTSRGVRLSKFRGSTVALDLFNGIAGSFSVKNRRDIDIVHRTYYAPTSYAPARSKRVLTVFDMIHERFPESLKDNGKTAAMKQAAVRNADHIICISENTRRDLIEILDVPERMTSVVYLGHSLIGKATAGSGYQPPCHKPYLLYVGNRGGYKNFMNLIAAYGQSRALRNSFAMIFFGGGGFTDDERQAMRSHGMSMEDAIHVEGGDEVLASLYSGAAAFIYPSLYEGFGIPPLEAMAHGCPVLCSGTSSLPEVVGEAAELFDPHDPNDICAAIERVVSSEQRSSTLIARGHEQIKRFSWKKCAIETLDQYQRLVGA
ncbi:glycosyltransferase family 4 protein [Dyella choica]|uniref:Glycosyltransferase family 1 protein n=1 Tax=Dyella choica TaxID=1927959 RepID=A0A3S0PPD8_9GAMM|nr:glycosyltransferase family 1 protein [Dyella choica]RUL76746.1 glycosyltransferase family 1 protein [Dyella choica]